MSHWVDSDPPEQRRMKAAIYHRVSTADQDPDGATRELRRAARRRGCRVVLAVTETGSGAKADRPGWAQVLEQARDLDWVFVWAIDRAGRSTLDLLGQIAQLRAAGCSLCAVSQGLELVAGESNYATTLTLQVLAACAEFERGILRERTRAGVARARARGKRLGRPPTPRPSRAMVERLRAKGATWAEIARRLQCTVWAARCAVSPAPAA